VRGKGIYVRTLAQGPTGVGAVGGRRPGLSAQVPKGSEHRRAIALYLVSSALEDIIVNSVEKIGMILGIEAKKGRTCYSTTQFIQSAQLISVVFPDRFLVRSS
jgi:hypothetical protein